MFVGRCLSSALVTVGAAAEVVLESAEQVNNLVRNVSILIRLQSAWIRTASPLSLRR